MQANQRVYRLAAVGRLLLTDCCGAMRDLPLSKRPERAILDSQPPGIGGMSVKTKRIGRLIASLRRRYAENPIIFARVPREHWLALHRLAAARYATPGDIIREAVVNIITTADADRLPTTGSFNKPRPVRTLIQYGLSRLGVSRWGRRLWWTMRMRANEGVCSVEIAAPHGFFGVISALRPRNADAVRHLFADLALHRDREALTADLVNLGEPKVPARQLRDDQLERAIGSKFLDAGHQLFPCGRTQPATV
jgi:hypothetical protein